MDTGVPVSFFFSARHHRRDSLRGDCIMNKLSENETFLGIHMRDINAHGNCTHIYMPYNL